MSHDLYAAWAATEITNILQTNPRFLVSDGISRNFTVYASKEGRTKWPIADGVILVEENGRVVYEIAIEFKRRNEGVHGVLTALGQAHAYLHKGYRGSIIVIPEAYDTHNNPSGHLKEIIEYTSDQVPIGVFSYKDPDVTKTSPFNGKITCIRHLNLNTGLGSVVRSSSPQNFVKTQWAHLREGSSDPDAFFRYLQTSKQLAIDSLIEPSVNFPPSLVQAIQDIQPGANPLKYLSNSIGNDLHDIVWRNFWFNYILTDEAIPIWNNSEGNYVINDSSTKIVKPDESGNKMFFAGRSDSIKNRLVNDLNMGNISESEAWKKYALKIRERAHSYREDIDSGLDHIGLLESDGKPSELGYRFVDACERTRNSNSGSPKALLGAAILKNGNLGAFLHYIYRLSEEKFNADPLAFTKQNNSSGRLQFLHKEYLQWLENELATNLKVMRKVSIRGGASRQPFQGELAILRNYEFVGNFRVGTGLKINWPKIQNAYEVEI
uniref:BspMI n=1 Tax=Bacillus sp. M(2010) TaxID=932685 RepID=E5Q8T6_9BACI|nr:BspMI [Bacillus sp. M(2010)]